MLHEDAKDGVIERQIAAGFKMATQHLEELAVRHVQHFDHPAMSDETYRQSLRREMNDSEHLSIDTLQGMRDVLRREQPTWWRR